MVEGYDVWCITCRGCGRKTERLAKPSDPNELVGKQDRMRCRACGHRGANLLRVWTQGKLPKR
jgi:DNA-directed RNA polymerase subunit RPC12/RpoP